MDEQQTPAQQTINTVTTVATTAAAATAVATAKKSKTPTPQQLVAQANNQFEILKQAETIKQLQSQVKLLEKQSADAGKVFLGTMTALVSSAFALVAALAWNSAVQGAFDTYLKNTSESVLGKFFYALFITIIVVLVIYYLTRLNRRVGARSLLDEIPHASEGGKKAEKPRSEEKD